METQNEDITENFCFKLRGGDYYFRTKVIALWTTTPLVPKYLYVPEQSLSLIKKFDFDAYFKEQEVDTVIIKDKFGFHTGQMVPYQLTSVGNINEQMKEFSKVAGRIEDFGGIIAEEFIGGLESVIYKNHIFGEVIPGETIKYNVQLDGLEGAFKSYSPGQSSLLKKVESEVYHQDPNVIDKLNPLIRKHLPYLFASLDYVIDTNNNPKVIDVTSIAGSLGEIQEMIGSNNHNPFEFFYEKCKTFLLSEFEKQIAYIAHLEDEFIKIKMSEGIFSSRDGTIINLM